MLAGVGQQHHLAPVAADHGRLRQLPAAGALGPRDACGAGDCFAAAAAQVIRDGGLLTEAVTEAVRWASEFVGRGGPAVVPGLTVPPEAERRPDRQPPARSAWEVAADVRRRGGRIVATLAKALSQKGPGSKGVISICAAGGLGVTAIMEAA